MARRRFVRLAASGTAVALLGGYYYVSDDLTRLAQLVVCSSSIFESKGAVEVRGGRVLARA